MDRIDPHQHPISAQELLAHLICERLVINCRLGLDAEIGKLLENPVKAIIVWCRGSSRFGIAAPQDCNIEGLLVWIASVHATLLAWRVTQSLDGRLTGCLLDPPVMLSALCTTDNPDPSRNLK